MQLLESPKHALGIRRVKSLIVIIEIDPTGLTSHIFAPLVGVFENRSAAIVVELIDAESLDLGATRNAKLAFSLNLGGKTVGIPAEATLNTKTAHRLIARHCVFGITSQKVTIVWQTVSERRAVIKDELRCVLVFQLVNRCLKSLIFRPKIKNLLFDSAETRAGDHAIAHAKRRSIVLWIHLGSLRVSRQTGEGSLSQC